MSRKVDVYDSNVETFQNYAERLEQSKATQPKVLFKAKPKKVHQLEEGTDFFSIDLQVHQSAVTTNKIWVHPVINNVRIRMELDTGSGLSLMTIRDFKAIFKKSPSLSTDRSIILNTYTGEKVSPLGYAHVVVTVNGVSKTLPLWIVKEGNNPLFGATDPDRTQPGATDPDLILPISLPKDTTRSQSAEPNPVTGPPPAPTVASTSASPSNLGTQPRRSGRITKPPVKLNL
ncbi:hypothetical protein RRG08_046220 [Elysia crispata]|uniref:Peptidase A2 domain-containing protein n=1 Tax=Elysia crispata TaxID=231223 RepID=A0AAE0YN57_9GAST|nr:hypothetical protein RRG08_046220 [Elysia crispata]